jgi:hypothetical protein
MMVEFIVIKLTNIARNSSLALVIKLYLRA